MASGRFTSWQVDGATMETVRDYFLGLQNHCRWWLQPWNEKTFASWKKSYDKWESILKSSTKVCLVKAMVFPAVMYGCETWTIKSTKNWCFWTVGLEKTLESPLDCKEIKSVNCEGNQSIVKEISPEYSLEGLMLKLKFQYFGHLMPRTDLL